MTDDQNDGPEPLDRSGPVGDDACDGPRPEKTVGYGCPPVATRFKPGQSGNPRGRPKGSKGVDQVLRQALDRRVPDPRRGGRHTVSMLELIVEGLVLAAARRDPRMIRLLVGLVDRYAPSGAPQPASLEIEAKDKDILDEYVASLTAALDKAGGEP
jgi:Family of unknown function (DUF5681)